MGSRGPKQRSRSEAWEYLLQVSRRTNDGCLLYERGKPIGIGYRRIQAGGFSWYVHHLAYFMENGPAQLSIIRRHTCDRPNCIEPTHIIGGTHADNVADKVAKLRHPHGKTHYRTKLTPVQVQEILASDKTYAELSRIYGISRGGIHNIKNGRSWKIETRTKHTLVLANLEDFS